MLKAMVQAAVNWMRAGLPLKLMKIVAYCRDDCRVRDADKLVAVFDHWTNKVKKMTDVPDVRLHFQGRQ
jgi:hypothetical protein